MVLNYKGTEGRRFALKVRTKMSEFWGDGFFVDGFELQRNGRKALRAEGLIDRSRWVIIGVMDSQGVVLSYKVERSVLRN